MVTMTRSTAPRRKLLVGAVVLAAACTNDYDAFLEQAGEGGAAAASSTSTGGAASSAGSATTTTATTTATTGTTGGEGGDGSGGDGVGGDGTGGDGQGGGTGGDGQGGGTGGAGGATGSGGAGGEGGSAPLCGVGDFSDAFSQEPTYFDPLPGGIDLSIASDELVITSVDSSGDVILVADIEQVGLPSACSITWPATRTPDDGAGGVGILDAAGTDAWQIVLVAGVSATLLHGAPNGSTVVGSAVIDTGITSLRLAHVGDQICGYALVGAQESMLGCATAAGWETDEARLHVRAKDADVGTNWTLVLPDLNVP
jgi:hypothetical protein